MSELFKNFNDIDLNYIYTDKHIHSKLTDGKSTILQIVKKSKEIGLTQIAITDHIRSDSKYFSAYCRRLRMISKISKFNILVGFETKVIDFLGNIDIRRSFLKKAKIKIVSVHRFPIGRRFYDPAQFAKKICQEIELELAIAAIKKGSFNILGHPGGMSLCTYNEFPSNFFVELILSCKREGVAFELSGKYHMPVLDTLIVLLKKYNPLVSFGSDAHSAEEVGSFVDVFKKRIISGKD
ncbi:PHP domain-containing protein [bacterium]|nr:MAG: PHP domain-containing protein [bacterium]